METAFVRINQLSKQYREGESRRLVFDQLDLNLHRSEFVALLGRSGAGKSTLLNLIGGIDLPDSGTVHIDGHCITAHSETERTRLRRRLLGFVFQFFNLIETLTVEENLLLPLALNGRDTAAGRQHALALLERVGLADRRRSFPERLSGGEQQRLAIVRALAHAPPLLLADEPTGNLDRSTGNRALDLLHELSRQTGTTVLMVTHSEEAAARADRRLYLVEGRLQEQAP